MLKYRILILKNYLCNRFLEGINMPTNIGDFFIVSNSVYNVTDEDYQKINLLVNAAKAFARSTHQCVYIIDYFKQNFLYVSENLAYWCGQTSDKIKDLRLSVLFGLCARERTTDAIGNKQERVRPV